MYREIDLNSKIRLSQRIGAFVGIALGLLCLESVWALPPAPAGLLSASDSSANSLVDFAKDIAPILQQKCLSCHGGDAAKNGFKITDRDALMGYIEPGKASESSLWTDYLVQPPKSKDAKSLVMPPDGPLTVAELATIQVWINDGAKWPADVLLGTERSAETADDSNRSFLNRIYAAIGYFHPAIVHFPIVLFMLSAACAALSPFLGLRCQSAAFHCLVLAVLFSMLTSLMGWSFAYSRGYLAWDRMLQTNATLAEQNFFYHRWLGTSIPVLGLVAVAIGAIGRRYKSNLMNNLWRIGTIGLAALVGLVGHQGGYLVYGDLLQRAIEQFTK